MRTPATVLKIDGEREGWLVLERTEVVAEKMKQGGVFVVPGWGGKLLVVPVPWVKYAKESEEYCVHEVPLRMDCVGCSK